MTKVKAGIVGFGSMAEKCHLRRMQESDLYDVVGVCDITESRRNHAVDLGLAVTDSLDNFLSWDIDMVVLATPSSQHYEDALKVAEAGKHMLIEKPLSVTAEEARSIVQTARKKNVVLTVFHNRHFDTDYRMVKSAIQEGLLGDIVSLENRTMGERPAVGFGVKDYDQSWRVTASAGGGTLHDFGPHWCEQILDLMEGHKVVQVFGDVRHFKWGDVNDHFRIDMVFDNGTRATVGKTDIAYSKLPYKWFILGTEATMHGPVDDRIIVSGSDYETHRSRSVEGEDLHVNLARHLLSQEPLIITAEHALRVMELLQAGMDSSSKGKSIDVSI